MAEKANTSLGEYLDPIAECARILELIVQLPDAQGHFHLIINMCVYVRVSMYDVRLRYIVFF